jgi:hypothetical protein
MPVNMNYVNQASGNAIPRNRATRMPIDRNPITPMANTGMIPSRKDIRGKLTNLQTKFGAATDPSQQSRISDRAGYLANRYGIKNSPFTGAPITTMPVDNPAVAPAPMVPDTSAQDNMRVLLPDFQDNYNYYADQGQSRMSKLMAARGQTGSSANITANRDFLTELGAKSAADRNNFANTTADRYEGMLTDSANRQRDASNTAWDRNMQYLDYLNRSLPPEILYGSAKDGASLATDAGGMKAGYTKDMYRRTYAPSGGGGMPFQAPFPTGPDFTNIDMMGMINGGSNSSYIDDLLKGAGSLFGNYKKK